MVNNIKTFDERIKELVALGKEQGYLTYEQLAKKTLDLDLDSNALDELYNVLTEDVNVLAMLGINSLYEFSYISKIVLLSYIIAGAFIGAVGTTISTKKYCKV